MTILDIPLFDDDFYKMSFRFLMNIGFLFLIIRYLYYNSTQRKDYLFTFFMVSIIVFFLCFTLKKFELGIGMALGLFAIFGIIRYRTDVIQIREMTYLFVVIGVSVMNALANKKMSYAELFFANLTIVGAIAVLEKYVYKGYEGRKKIVYENIENIKPENHEILKADLEQRTGLKIKDISIENIDFLRDTAIINICYDIEK